MGQGRLKGNSTKEASAVWDPTPNPGNAVRQAIRTGTATLDRHDPLDYFEREPLPSFRGVPGPKDGELPVGV